MLVQQMSQFKDHKLNNICMHDNNIDEISIYIFWEVVRFLLVNIFFRPQFPTHFFSDWGLISTSYLCLGF